MPPRNWLDWTALVGESRALRRRRASEGATVLGVSALIALGTAPKSWGQTLALGGVAPWDLSLDQEVRKVRLVALLVTRRAPVNAA